MVIGCMPAWQTKQWTPGCSERSLILNHLAIKNSAALSWENGSWLLWKCTPNVGEQFCQPFLLAFILFGHLLLYCLWVRFCSFTEQCYFLGGELQWPLEYVHAQENTIAVSIIYLIIQQHAGPLHVLRWDNGLLVHIPSFDDQFNFPFYDKTHKWELLFLLYSTSLWFVGFSYHLYFLFFFLFWNLCACLMLTGWLKIHTWIYFRIVIFLYSCAATSITCTLYDHLASSHSIANYIQGGCWGKLSISAI